MKGFYALGITYTQTYENGVRGKVVANLNKINFDLGSISYKIVSNLYTVPSHIWYTRSKNAIVNERCRVWG